METNNLSSIKELLQLMLDNKQFFQQDYVVGLEIYALKLI